SLAAHRPNLRTADPSLGQAVVVANRRWTTRYPRPKAYEPDQLRPDNMALSEGCQPDFSRLSCLSARRFQPRAAHRALTASPQPWTCVRCGERGSGLWRARL